MSCDPFADMANAFAIAAYANTAWKRLVFQRLPVAGETQTDARGRPTSNYTDIDPTHSIPCIFTCKSGSEVIIAGQTKSVTLYSFTIPSLYQTDDGHGNLIYKTVDFSPKYRTHLLASGSSPEHFFQIIGGGDDLNPALIFSAVRLEEMV